MFQKNQIGSISTLTLWWTGTQNTKHQRVDNQGHLPLHFAHMVLFSGTDRTKYDRIEMT